MTTSSAPCGTPPDITALHFHRRRHSSVDTGHVRVAGPHHTTVRTSSLGDEHAVVAEPGAYVIHADEGTTTTCHATREWGPARYLRRLGDDGTWEDLGTYRTWDIAQDAAAAHAMGMNLRDPATRSLLERRWWDRTVARRRGR